MKASSLIEKINNHEYDARFEELYMDKDLVAGQCERYVKAVNEFIALYGDLEVELYSAPGRTEIGGNHTDHQYGKVLAGPVNIDTIAVASATDDMTVNIKSEGYNALTVKLENLEAKKSEYGTSYALIKGVAAGLAKRGYKIGGFKAYVTSQVLSGSGLSSSAAYEVLLGNILSGLYNDCSLNSVLIAQIGQEAENIYFGKPCGLLDQMASSVGGLVHVDFADPKNPLVMEGGVEFNKFGHSLCIVDTKGSHADLTDDYAAIPAEMKAVAAVFGKEVLSQVEEAEFYAKIAEVRKATSDRSVLRAIHWFNETKRADKQIAALRADDFDEFKRLIRESGDSSYKYLQNVYSNHKITEQSLGIGLAMTEEILGKDCACRVHGGGFAGTIQVFVPNEKVAVYKEGIEKVFGAGSCYVLKIREIGGTRV